MMFSIMTITTTVSTRCTTDLATRLLTADMMLTATGVSAYILFKKYEKLRVSLILILQFKKNNEGYYKILLVFKEYLNNNTIFNKTSFGT